MRIKDMNVEELKSFVERNNLTVEGTGKNGSIIRPDLEKAIEAAGLSENDVSEAETIEEQYVVLKPFKDLKDDNYIYEKAGEDYPRNSKQADPERVKELLSTDNKRKEPVIKIKDGE